PAAAKETRCSIGGGEFHAVRRHLVRWVALRNSSGGDGGGCTHPLVVCDAAAAGNVSDIVQARLALLANCCAAPRPFDVDHLPPPVVPRHEVGVIGHADVDVLVGVGDLVDEVR